MRIFTFRNPYSLVIWYFVAVLVCLTVVHFYGLVFAGVFGLLGAIYPMYAAVGGYGLCKELRLRGYDWVTLKMGYRLVARYFSKAWRIPPREDAATIPGYQDNFEGLEMIVLRGHGLPEPWMRLPEVQEWMDLHGSLPEPPPLPLYIRLTVTGRGLVLMFLILNTLLWLYVMDVGWQAGTIFMVNIFITPIWLLLMIIFLRSRLRELGYGELKWKTLVYLSMRLQQHVWRTPRHEDMQAVLNTKENISPEILFRAMACALLHKRMKKRVELLMG